MRLIKMSFLLYRKKAEEELVKKIEDSKQIKVIEKKPQKRRKRTAFDRLYEDAVRRSERASP